MPKQAGAWLFEEYLESQKLMAGDPSFYALIMAAMRKADTNNVERLKAGWPLVWKEFIARYHAPGGALTQKEMNYVTRLKEGY